MKWVFWKKRISLCSGKSFAAIYGYIIRVYCVWYDMELRLNTKTARYSLSFRFRNNIGEAHFSGRRNCVVSKTELKPSPSRES